MQSPFPPTTEQSCKNCRYLRSAKRLKAAKTFGDPSFVVRDFDGVLECREGSPVPARGLDPCWPQVQPSDWCGQWAPAEDR